MSTTPPPPDILSPEFAADPHSAYRTLRTHYPLSYHPATGSYLLSRYRDVERAFRDPAFTCDNYAWQIEPMHGGRTLSQMSGREHAEHRALVAPAFRGRELRETYRPMIERAAAELIDDLRGAAEADLVARFTTLFPVNVVIGMLGLDRADRHRIHRWYGAVVAFLSNIAQDPDIAAAGLRTREELAAYLLPLIRARRGRPGADLLSVLCTAEVDGRPLADREITAYVSLLLAAGGETADKTLAALLRNLLAHPQQLAAVRADRSLVPAALAETLRWTSPVQMLMRETAEEVVLSGGTVPAGATVTCLIGSANRDEDRFGHPDEFDVLRTDLPTDRAFTAAANHLAFGQGRHFCAGALLARTEIEVAVNRLLDAFPDLHLTAAGPPADTGVFTRAPSTLPVRLAATAAAV